MIGIIYFLVIILANTIGAISGMGGGVLIKPIFDFMGYHPIAAISFYSSVAVFMMSIVSTTKQLTSGRQFNWKIIVGVSTSAIIGGVLGNGVFELLLYLLKNDSVVQLIQIMLTMISLLFAYCYSKYNWKSYHLNHVNWYILCGITLGFLASLLGIGGGPINVSLLMLMFSLPIKDATVYSICTIFFSQLAKLISIFISGSYLAFDLSLLGYIVPAAIIGGLLGARLSHKLSQESVSKVFQFVIILVLMINLYNGFKLL
nr:sulfite exporter TauE/SafE family protein [Carnobacterium maltaromaticum]